MTQKFAYGCSQGNLYQPKQGARGGWAQLGICWLWVPSRVNPLLSWPCLLFKRILSFAECKRMGTFCYRDCLSKKCAMWWPGVIWIEYIFHVGFSAGCPSWQVLTVSDSTLEHHVVSRWCQPHTVPPYHLQTFICFSGLLLYENGLFLFLHSQGHQKNMVQEDVTPGLKIWLCTNFLKLAFILGLDNVCSVWNIFLSTPEYMAWKGVDIFLNLKYYGSAI